MFEFPKCVDYDYYNSSSEEAVIPEPKPRRKTKPKVPKPVFKCYADELDYYAYQEHRERLATAGSLVDKDPVYMNSTIYANLGSLRQDAITFMNRTMDNIGILLGLNLTKRIQRDNYFRKEAVISHSTALTRNIEKIKTIEHDNFDMGKRIQDIRSSIDTGRIAEQQVKKPVEKPPFELPKRGLEKYHGYLLSIPKSDNDRRQLFRPVIFFDVHVKDSRPLGRVIVQLFTEAAPLVVLHLVQACMDGKYKDFNIRRLFPQLWLDIEMPLEKESKLHSIVEYDGKAIDHGTFDNVLSFRKDFLQGFASKLKFSMSFKPLSVANGKRVGFGRVVRGGKILKSLETYGTKNGALHTPIIFTDCGVL